MPDQPEELEPPSRFRLSDVQTRAVSSFGTLEDLTTLLRYLLSRIDSQAAEIRRKAALYEALDPSMRAVAVRELRDNVKELKTGVIRHGLDASAFPGLSQRRLAHEAFGLSLPVSDSRTRLLHVYQSLLRRMFSATRSRAATLLMATCLSAAMRSSGSRRSRSKTSTRSCYRRRTSRRRL